MEQTKHYRHELKYSISYGQYLELGGRLRLLMRPDPHVNASGSYLVRSIYFDNLDDKILREKIFGASRREKFRIRYYNDDFSVIMLEKKVKHNQLGMKFHAALTEDECRRLLDGDTVWMRGHPSELVQELYAKMRCELLRPRVLVSYVRKPYLFEPGNVRITFDSNIRTTMYHRKFLETKVQDIGTADVPGEIILEVKYDAFLPEVIEDMIQISGVRQQAFSKYGICRRFG